VSGRGFWSFLTSRNVVDAPLASLCFAGFGKGLVEMDGRLLQRNGVGLRFLLPFLIIISALIFPEIGFSR